MFTTWFRVASAVLGAGLLVGCASAAPSADADAASQRRINTFQTNVSNLNAAGVSAVVAQVNNAGVLTNAVAGTSELNTASPVDIKSHYRTASITKTFVATVVLQLVGEGRLSLDDTVDRWLPGVIMGNGNDGTRITVRNLLQQTSGLFDYTADNQFISTVATPAAFDANKDHQYTPQDLLNIALSHPPVFNPGTAFQYANTNYIVAGLVIKAVTGNMWDVEVANRIITPLGLVNTSIPGSVTSLPAPFAHGYNIWSPAPNRVYTDTTVHNMSWADAAASIVTTVSDETKFWATLMSGGLLPPAQLTQMKTTVPINTKTGYGLGIARTRLCKTDLWWHWGRTFGYETLAISTATGSTTVVYNLASTSVVGNDSSFTSATDSAEDKLVKDALCGSSATNSDSITAQEYAVAGGSVIPIR